MEKPPATQKHIAVINGTSRTGKYLIQFGLASGLHVTSIVRSAARFNAAQKPHDNLTVAEIPDVTTDIPKLQHALVGVDTIFIAVAPPANEPTTIVEDVIRSIIATTDKPRDAVLKVILLSSFTIHPRGEMCTDPAHASYLVRFLRNHIVKHFYDDLERAHALLDNTPRSKLEYAVVNPGMLVDVPETDDTSRNAFENKKSPGHEPLTMSYERLAVSMLSLLDDWAEWRGEYIVPEATSKIKFGWADVKSQRDGIWDWVKKAIRRNWWVGPLLLVLGANVWSVAANGLVYLASTEKRL